MWLKGDGDDGHNHHYVEDGDDYNEDGDDFNEDGDDYNKDLDDCNEDGDDDNKDEEEYNEDDEDHNDFSHLQHLGRDYYNRPAVRSSLSEPEKNISTKMTLHLSKGIRHAPDF